MAILSHLAHFLQRHGELLGQFLRRRLTPDLVQHLARGAHDLVDRLDHVDRDTDGAGLVGDRAGNRLPDPPGGVGRELVAATILEFVDRLHQADIAFLNQIQELQAAIRIFLGDRDHETQIGLDHLLLGLARLALALLHHVHDLAEFRDLETGFRGEGVDLVAQVVDLILAVGDEVLPALAAQLGDAQQPFRIELVALIIAQEILAPDTEALGIAHQPALMREQALVDVVELLDQCIDAVSG